MIRKWEPVEWTRRAQIILDRGSVWGKQWDLRALMLMGLHNGCQVSFVHTHAYVQANEYEKQVWGLFWGLWVESSRHYLWHRGGAGKRDAPSSHTARLQPIASEGSAWRKGGIRASPGVFTNLVTHAGPWSPSPCPEVHRYSEKLLGSEAQAGAEFFLLSLIYAEAAGTAMRWDLGTSEMRHQFSLFQYVA